MSHVSSEMWKCISRSSDTKSLLSFVCGAPGYRDIWAAVQRSQERLIVSGGLNLRSAFRKDHHVEPNQTWPDSNKKLWLKDFVHADKMLKEEVVACRLHMVKAKKNNKKKKKTAPQQSQGTETSGTVKQTEWLHSWHSSQLYRFMLWVSVRSSGVSRTL